jgi:histidine triad (HIT) family protein
MSENCLFCKIISGQIPAAKLYEDDEVLAFADISPQAPTHFLVIPKRHLRGPDAITEADQVLIGKVMRVGAEIAKGRGVEGFRFVVNNGAEAGQTVFHFHLHVLGGRPMAWPPG